jgi:CHAD domain-containing protein
MTSLASSATPEQTFREAMHLAIAHRWRMVWQAIPRAIEGSDPEAVHDVRVASRRLRAAMDVAGPAFPYAWFRDLHRLAREITSELGAVRDLEVRIAYFESILDDAGPADRAGIDRLLRRLRDQHEVARRHMIAYLTALEDGPACADTERRFSVEPESTAGDRPA